jgi:hypothetical protein
MADQLRDLSDQLLWWAFLLLPSALFIDCAILGLLTYWFWRPDVVRWARKKRQAHILKKRFDVEIRQGGKAPIILRQGGYASSDRTPDRLPKVYPGPAPGARPGPYDDEIPERVSVKSWPYRPTKPQSKP